MATVIFSPTPLATRFVCVANMDEFYVFLGMMAVTVSLLGILAIYYGVKEWLLK